MKLVHWLTSLALLTASFDILLALSVGGTIRFAQIMLLCLIILGFAKVLDSRRLLWPRGGYAITAWCLLQVPLLTQSPNPLLALQPLLLLFFMVAGLFAMLQLYGRSTLIEPLMRIYLISFVFVATFGAIQFLVPGHPLVVQWIIYGIIPRINGFSFEPSYFATYLVMGWIMLIDLRLAGARIAARRRWYWAVWLISAVLFFSTSKTAWLLMIGEALARVLPIVFRLGQRQFRRLREGSFLVPLPSAPLVLGTIAAVCVTFALLTTVSRFIDLNRFLSGTGLNGTPAHSLNDRVGGFLVTWKLVQDHFWIGLGMGGVNESVAAALGHNVTSLAEMHTYWGFPVPLDVFAASGFWCFLPFLWFFIAITHGESRLIRTHWNDERAKWLHALVRAMIFEWLALLADQNLLRLYFWFHVTMVVIVGYNLRYSNAEERIPAESLVIA